MNYCKYCKVEILDDTDICPLCRNILKTDNDRSGREHTGSLVYPDIISQKKKISIWLRLMTFLAIAVSLVSVFINYNFSNHFMWSLIVVCGLLYALWILSLIARGAGYIRKMLVSAIGGVFMVVLIDLVTGFHRWSVNFVLPGSMLLVDLAFIILMIVNRKNWQGYMLYQILMVVVAFIPMILLHFHIVTFPLVSEIAVLSAVLVFLGTLIIGGATARTEMKRRFHI